MPGWLDIGDIRFASVLFTIYFIFQSNVMQLTDDSTKLKLFMDVLNGTKATVSHYAYGLISLFPLSLFYSLFFVLLLFLFFPVDDAHVCALSSSWVHDGHFTPDSPQAVEKVCADAFDK